MTAPATRLASYRRLDDARIVETLTRLRDRIEERFPGSGLGRVSSELLAVAREATACVEYLRRPHWPVRVSIGVAIVVMLVVLATVVMTVRVPTRVDRLTDFVQGIEAGINDLVEQDLAKDHAARAGDGEKAMRRG